LEGLRGRRLRQLELLRLELLRLLITGRWHDPDRAAQVRVRRAELLGAGRRCAGDAQDDGDG
jgi:hypothetical protein